MTDVVAGEEKEEGKPQPELYIPRKCSATNRIIGSKDHASIQINIGHLDPNGHFVPGQFSTFAFGGYIRKIGESDNHLNRLAANENTPLWVSPENYQKGPPPVEYAVPIRNLTKFATFEKFRTAKVQEADT